MEHTFKCTLLDLFQSDWIPDHLIWSDELLLFAFCTKRTSVCNWDNCTIWIYYCSCIRGYVAGGPVLKNLKIELGKGYFS